MLKQFSRDVFWSFTSLVTAAIVHFLLRIVLARYYSAADLGLYTLAFTAYSIGITFSGFGIGTALTKYTAARRDDPGHLKQLHTVGVVISLVSGIAAGLVLYFSAPLVANHFFRIPELTGPLRIISFVFPFIGLQKATLGFLNGLRRMRSFAIINISQNIATLILTTAFALVGYGVVSAIIMLVVPVMLVSVASLFFLRGYFGVPSNVNTLVRVLISFGLFVVLANGIGTLQLYADTTIIGHYLSEIEVGIYAVAVTLAIAVRLPPQSIQMITGPVISSYWEKREISSIEYLVNRCMKYTAFYTVPVTFLVAFLSPELISLFFGEDYLNASLPLQILLIGAIPAAIQTAVGSALSSTAFVRMVFWLSGGGVLVNIILGIILVPLLGIIGAAIATSSSMVASSLVQLYFTKRMIGIHYDMVWFGRFFAFSLVVIGVAFVVARYLNLYVVAGISLLVLVLVSLCCFVSADERQAINKFFHLKAG